MLFTCAHPQLDPALHAPLMLQCVLGLSAARIAPAFLVSPAAMGQRLVRAKQKLREHGVVLTVPERGEWPARLAAVLAAIYVAFGRGWEDAVGGTGSGVELADEAIWLGRALVQLLPAEPEALGLLALMLFCRARRNAQRTADGRYVPLAEQDVALWSAIHLAEAERHLAAAATCGQPGRFQLEAAIQSAHCERARGNATPWRAIAALYAGLVRIAPSIGTRVGYAASLEEALGPGAALAALDAIDQGAVRTYQPYWAVRVHLSGRLGRRDEASAAYERAMGRSEDPAVRRYLFERRAAVAGR